MEIPQNIIEKFKLWETNERNGQSFINNLRVFALPSFKVPIRFMESDFMGQPTDYILIHNRETKKYIEVTPEYLQDASIEMIIEQLKGT